MGNWIVLVVIVVPTILSSAKDMQVKTDIMIHIIAIASILYHFTQPVLEPYCLPSTLELPRANANANGYPHWVFSTNNIPWLSHDITRSYAMGLKRKGQSRKSKLETC